MDRASGMILEGVTAVLLIALWCAPLATAAFAAYKYATPDKSFTTVSAESGPSLTLRHGFIIWFLLIYSRFRSGRAKAW